MNAITNCNHYYIKSNCQSDLITENIDTSNCAKFIAPNGDISYAEVNDDNIFYNSANPKRNLKRILTFVHKLHDYSFFISEIGYNDKHPIAIKKLNKQYIKAGKTYYLHLEPKNKYLENNSALNTLQEKLIKLTKYVYDRTSLLEQIDYAINNINIELTNET